MGLKSKNNIIKVVLIMLNKKLLETLKLMNDSKDGEFTSSVSKLTKNVVSIVLDECKNKPVEYIKNIMDHGYVDGKVSSLDTEKFFFDNVDEILHLTSDYFDEFCCYNDKLNTNNLAWFGFKQTLITILEKLDINLTRKNNNRFINYFKFIDTLMEVDKSLHYDNLLYQCDFDLNHAYDLLYDSLQITIQELENKKAKPYIEVRDLVSFQQWYKFKAWKKQY